MDHKEGWVLKKWCFWTVVLQKTLASPLDFKELKQSILKEISPEYSLEGLMLKLRLQYLGHLMWRADLLGKNPDAGQDWRQDEKGMAENEMVGWHHQLTGLELEQAQGDGERQGSLACCSPWGWKTLDITGEWLKNNNKIWLFIGWKSRLQVTLFFTEYILMREDTFFIWFVFTFFVCRAFLIDTILFSFASLVAQLVKNLPAMQETAWNARDCLQCRRPGFDHRVRNISWIRKWQPTPVFLPGESHGQRSLMGRKSWTQVSNSAATKYIWKCIWKTKWSLIRWCF